MILKLAYRNVRKSYQDFMIYFVTLMFSVCLFYTFNSFQAQQEMMVLREQQNAIMGTVSIFMVFLSVFVAMVLAGLIVYANRFLMRRRKKEFGLYMLMGMEDSTISRILVCETFFIGLVSMIFGLLLGIGFSQVLGVITAKVMEVEISFQVVFSFSAMIMTVTAFGLIFLFTMFSNARVMRKQKLIDLIRADQQHEKQRLHSFMISILLFVCSLVLLALTYYLATDSIISFGNYFMAILVLGASGTILFFFSLTGFLLRFISHSKSLYYRNLHMFVLRQVHSSINTSFLSMSIVCLMLLLSIGALATGWNLNLGMSTTYDIIAPYDMSFIDKNSSHPTFVMEEELLKQQGKVDLYESNVTMMDLYQRMDDEDMRQAFQYEIPMNAIPYSQYVNVCKQKDIPAVTLSDNEYVFYAPIKDMMTLMDHATEQDSTFTFFDQPLIAGAKAIHFQPETNSSLVRPGVIVPDTSIPSDLTPISTSYNFDFQEGVDIASVQQNFDVQFSQEDYDWFTVTRLEAYDNSISMGMLFTYIGLYLGIVFLMASAVLLALQQLSDADRNTQQYEILRKIGVEKKQMTHSIYEQVGIYFLLPLVLAIIHSYYGIQAVTGSFSAIFGTGNMFMASLMSGGVIVVIYGIYFLFTVKSYQRIILSKL